MADNSEIIKEYLVALGFKVDDNSLNKFDSAIGKTTVNVGKFAGILLSALAVTTVFADKVASKMADLYWSSVRLRDGAANIRDFQLLISKLGGSSAGAMSALESLDETLKTNPAAEGILRNFGIETRDGEHNLRGSVELLKEFAKLPLPLWLKVQWGQYFGLDYETLMATIRGDTAETEAVVSKLWDRAGISAKDATQRSVEFENRLKDQEATWGVIADVLATRLYPALAAVLDLVSDLLGWLLDVDKATGGLSTDFVVLGGAIWGVNTALSVTFGAGIIKMLGTLLARIALLTVTAFPALAEAIWAVGTAMMAASGWWLILFAGLAAGAVYIISHWDKVKDYYNGLVGWFRDKYNAVAKYLGLPSWDAPPAAPAAGDAQGATGGLPDYRDRERGLDARSVYTGAAAPAAGKDGREGRIAEALAYFQRMSWTPEQASGIVGSLLGENWNLDPKLTGDHGHAVGIAQWQEPRQADYKKWSGGQDISTANFEQQLAFIQHEMVSGNDRGARTAGVLLDAAQTVAAATDIFTRYFERPGDIPGDIQKRTPFAEKLLSGAKLSSPAGQGATSVKIEQNNEFRISSTADAGATARATGRELSRVNGDLTRNMAGAVT